MHVSALQPCVSLFSLRPVGFTRRWRWLGFMMAVLLLTGEGLAEGQAESDFGQAIQLAPFVVNGAPFSISIHARTKADRRYAEKFAEEVVEIAYATLDDYTAKGLIIVGEKGEPHPILIFRKFMEMAQAGQLDPGLAKYSGEAEGLLKKFQEKLHFDVDPKHPTGITFDMVMPAVPLPLEGVASKLYQLAWAEGFDDARIEARFKSLTLADFSRDELTRFDWVFYLPPYVTTTAVLKDVINQAMKAQKMGVFKRAAVRSALFVFAPAVRKGIESMRSGVLYMTILRAKGKYNEGDIDALTKVYVRELMPDLKPGSGNEHRRALAAIEKQKIANAEYAKDPFVKPARLATYDPASYAPFEGAYTTEPPEANLWFKREGESFQWNYKKDKPRIFYPAGDGLLVNEDGSMTIRFLVDATGTVTGVEERWVRRRQTIPRVIAK